MPAQHNQTTKEMMDEDAIKGFDIIFGSGIVTKGIVAGANSLGKQASNPNPTYNQNY